MKAVNVVAHYCQIQGVKLGIFTDVVVANFILLTLVTMQ